VGDDGVNGEAKLGGDLSGFDPVPEEHQEDSAHFRRQILRLKEGKLEELRPDEGGIIRINGLLPVEIGDFLMILFLARAPLR
jgi:hypothetical protein